MRYLTKVMLMLAVTLSAGRAFALVSNPSLDINVTVSIDATVRVEWTDATTLARTWDLGNSTSLDTDYDTLAISGATNIFDVKNKSQIPVSVAMGVNNQGNWIHKKKTGFPGLIDQFWIQVSKNNIDFSAPVELPDSGTTTLTASLARNATQFIDLQLHTPTDVSTANGGGIIVRMTASAL